MFIIPMNGITPLDSMKSIVPQENINEVDKIDGDSTSFTDVFKQALNNVEETRRIAEEDSIKVALGEVDELHTVQINLEKAATALDVLVTMKNTAVDSYNEIMRMGI